jgi:DNA-binding response OmpR family regulator
MDARESVLLVEDEPLVAAVTADALGELGFAVVDVKTAQAALDALSAGDSKFDFAIIDLGLPDRPGEELIVELKRMRPNLPVVIASGYDMDKLPAALAGQSGLVMLGKPYDSADLEAAIDKLSLREPSGT